MHLLARVLVLHLDLELPALLLDLRFLVVLEPDEGHSEPGGFLVVLLPEPVGPDVPVEHVDLGVRVLLLDLDRRRHRARAADAGAVRVALLTGAHTLYERVLVALRLALV